MIGQIVTILGLLASCIYALELTDGKVVLNDKPGRLYMWSNGINGAHENHVTKSVDINYAVDALTQQADQYEVIVVISPDSKETTSSSNCMHKNELMKEVYSSAKNQQTLYYVYATQASTSLDSAVHRVLATATSPTTKVHTLHDLQHTLHENPKVLFDGKKDVFQIPASAVHAQDAHHKEILRTLSTKPILFVTYDNVDADQQKKATRQLGEYASMMSQKSQAAVSTAASATTTDSTSIYYSPEGAEYAIYYADTYLYITPDIFTGLMTGIFMFFVGLIGLTCLGSIQGNTTYVDKLPYVGREA